jgi:hypothetical protein
MQRLLALILEHYSSFYRSQTAANVSLDLLYDEIVLESYKMLACFCKKLWRCIEGRRSLFNKVEFLKSYWTNA